MSPPPAGHPPGARAPLLDPAGFSRSLGAAPDRLHLAAHSHHPWPDVTREAHLAAWDDAAALLDDKWEQAVFADVVPTARGHLAALLGTGRPDQIAVGVNTHELVTRVLSCAPTPMRVLTTDGEFHSAARQLARYEEAGLAAVERVPAEPHPTLATRLAQAAGTGGHDVVIVSHVLFDSGAVVDVDAVVAAVADPATLVIVDAYHAVMARPVDYAGLADRAFVTGGGYKYAMAGEGTAWLHCPDGYAPRPVDTGWFAAFEVVAGADHDHHRPAPAASPSAPARGDGAPDPGTGAVAYGPGGARFAGATLDPTGWYRFNAVQRWLAAQGVGPGEGAAHGAALPAELLDRLDARGGARGDLTRAALVPPPGCDRGAFLTFRTDRAPAWRRALAARGVVVDHRDDRLRVGLGGYHGSADVAAFVDHVAAIGDP